MSTSIDFSQKKRAISDKLKISQPNDLNWTPRMSNDRF